MCDLLGTELKAEMLSELFVSFSEDIRVDVVIVAVAMLLHMAAYNQIPHGIFKDILNEHC